ncbi:tRNA lysidine(34) synthetase TilS [Spirosoma taeanense]|uniref:tRNA(Ile)-lysidine synthase n=2 Tax=Spirosoma taeanense TaxID=2735870 RepID=A0A6M5YEB4_9BACT|nr:tRNA lysidine(34) synthetase TilS [Spirosoma taeanense]
MLEQRFLGFINDNRLIGPADRVLLAVSGGLDSVVMAEVFFRTGQSFALAHVNFGLRGVESDADAHFVQNIAARYGVPFHLTRFDTASVATERGISIQMAARDLRYDWFAQLIQAHGYASVATAHHQNDVLETLLLNLTRGTGLAGLHGIAARQGSVIRPLLFATRDELKDYADTHQVTFREDQSNADDTYARNRIRHHVVPVLAELNPGLWQTFPRTIGRLRAAEVLMQAELDRSWQTITETEGDRTLLRTNALLALPEPAFRLGEWLKPFGFTLDQAGQMLDALSRPPGQVFQSATHRVTHERSGLLLTHLTPLDWPEIRLDVWPDAPIDVAGRFWLTIETMPRPIDFKLPADPNIACLDADRLSFPLLLRPWQLGDRFQPLGLQGHKLVSDLLNDLKLSRAEREGTLLLLSGGQIAWVIGRRISHHVRITPQTRRVARLVWVAQ